MRKFTKYPQGYVKASTETDPYMKDLAEYLDYLSDSEISALKVDTYNGDMEPTIWLVIPEHLRNTVENAVGIDLCTPSEDYFYQIEYHPDDDSIFFGIDTDRNVETLSVSKQTEDRFKAKFKKELGESVFSASTIKANDVYKVSDDPAVYTNLNFGDMYSELDKDYASTPNAKGFISDSIDMHYYKYHLITKAEADALRAKYLGD